MLSIGAMVAAMVLPLISLYIFVLIDKHIMLPGPINFISIKIVGTFVIAISFVFPLVVITFVTWKWFGGKKR